MSRLHELSYEFVSTIPDKLEVGTLYVSMEYATVVHRCCCGCGNEVVTPLSPIDWKLTYDGEGISLHPSVGNWSFKCRSHYWVKSNKILWEGDMTDEQIRQVREIDKLNKKMYFDSHPMNSQENASKKSIAQPKKHFIIWGIIRKWFTR